MFYKFPYNINKCLYFPKIPCNSIYFIIKKRNSRLLNSEIIATAEFDLFNLLKLTASFHREKLSIHLHFSNFFVL